MSISTKPVAQDVSQNCLVTPCILDNPLPLRAFAQKPCERTNGREAHPEKEPRHPPQPIPKVGRGQVENFPGKDQDRALTPPIGEMTRERRPQTPRPVRRRAYSPRSSGCPTHFAIVARSTLRLLSLRECGSADAFHPPLAYVMFMARFSSTRVRRRDAREAWTSQSVAKNPLPIPVM